MREGINIEIMQKEVKEPLIIHHPYGFDGMAFDYEYHGTFIEKLDSSYVSTKIKMVSKPLKFVESFRKNWNRLFNTLKLNFLKIGRKNIALYSILR